MNGSLNGVGCGKGRNDTLRTIQRFCHLYSPVSRMWAQPRGEMCGRNSGTTDLVVWGARAMTRLSNGCFVICRLAPFNPPRLFCVTGPNERMGDRATIVGNYVFRIGRVI